MSAEEMRERGWDSVDIVFFNALFSVDGGYNSLMDVLHAGTPALVVLRGMADGEQERHVAALAGRGLRFEHAVIRHLQDHGFSGVPRVVVRGDELVTVSHTLPPLEIDFPYLILSLIGIAYLLIGLGFYKVLDLLGNILFFLI